MDWFLLLLSRTLAKKMGGGGSGGGGADLASLDVYIADYLGDAPTITTGALDTLNRRIYGT